MKSLFRKEDDLLDTDGLFAEIRRLLASEHLDNENLKKDIWDRYGTECAMMVLDSSGFTRCTRESGIINYLGCIAAIRELIEPLLLDHSCLSCRARTDNVFAEFRTADQALEASMDIQREISSAPVSIDGEKDFGVCIGIGYGPVLISGEEGVFGDQMNLASKLGEDIAGKGEILLTESAFMAISEEYRPFCISREATASGVLIPHFLYDPDHLSHNR